MNDPRPVSNPWVTPATLWWFMLFALMMGVAEYTRPPLPVDETRYLAVAWEMFRSDNWVNYIVPHLNGEPYDHKPPLLFWLMTVGWHIFGVNDWWAALVAPLFGLVSLGLTIWVADLIWPRRVLGNDAAVTAAMAPVLLIGGLFWALFSTLTMFDMMLAAFTLMGIGGLLKAYRHGGKTGWALMALAIGFGVLAKGPAILLHILPAALLAPLWAPQLVGADTRPAQGWKGWHLRIVLAILIGAGIALSWAIPAGILGGEVYREAIFWGQSAGRVVAADDHARPWYWFLMVFPVMILPWIIWPPMWRAFGKLPRALGDAGVRLSLVWIIPAFVTFSMISGKQAHYLLPELPALSLLAARLLTEPGLADRARPRDQWWPVLPLALLMLAAAIFPYLEPLLSTVWDRYPEEAAFIDGYWMLAGIAAAALLVLIPIQRLMVRVMALSGLMATLVIAVHMAMMPLLMTHYDLRPLGKQVAAWMEEGRPVAYFGKYHGQFQFTGRLPAPVERIPAEIFETTDDWAWEHPYGIVIFQSRERIDDDRTLFVHPFRSRYLIAWPASAVYEDPRVVVNGMNKGETELSWDEWDDYTETLRPELVREGKVPRDWSPFGPPEPEPEPEHTGEMIDKPSEPSAPGTSPEQPALETPGGAPEALPEGMIAPDVMKMPKTPENPPKNP